MVALANPQKILLLPLSKITADERCQARAQIDPQTVQEYAEAKKSGELFPAGIVFFDGVTYWLADGFTRKLAYERIGHRHMEVVVKEGSMRDAILFAVSANIKHGARRTNDDKHRALRILLCDDEWCRWNNSEIARRCGVSNFLVREERRILAQHQDSRIVRRGGSRYAMDVSGMSEAERFRRADKLARYKAQVGKCRTLAARLRKKHEWFGEDAADGLEALDSYLICLDKLA